jgi:hypothetical protein
MFVLYVLDSPKATIVPMIDKNILVCTTGSTGTTISTILYSFNGALWLLGVILAFKVRNVKQKKYNERFILLNQFSDWALYVHVCFQFYLVGYNG